MAKAPESNFFRLDNPFKILYESALFSLMKCRTVGLMTALMAARLEAKQDMRLAAGTAFRGEESSGSGRDTRAQDMFSL